MWYTTSMSFKNIGKEIDLSTNQIVTGGHVVGKGWVMQEEQTSDFLYRIKYRYYKYWERSKPSSIRFRRKTRSWYKPMEYFLKVTVGRLHSKNHRLQSIIWLLQGQYGIRNFIINTLQKPYRGDPSKMDWWLTTLLSKLFWWENRHNYKW